MVYIAIDGNSGGKRSVARTLAPAQANFTRYMASFSGPESQADREITGGGASVNLAQGVWSITVTAFTGTGPYSDAGRGSATVTVESGNTHTADITITPVIEGGRNGDFRYSASIPFVDSASLSLINMTTGMPVSNTPIDLKAAADSTGGVAADIRNLDAGYYLMNIWLQQSGKYAGRTEVVHIYHGLETGAVFVFTDNDFSLGLSLDDGEWHDADMTVSGPEYYRFPVTSGAAYEVYWNDSYSGHGKTLDIRISAYYEGAGTFIFSGDDGGYDTPKTFTAALSDNVIIKIEPYTSGNTGTYAVRYIDEDLKTSQAAAAFTSAHSVILAKTVGDIAIADETAVDNALADYEGLPPAAQEMLIDEKTLLDSLKTKIGDLKVAQAAAFTSDHSVILAKTVGDIAIADETAVDNALADYDGLPSAVQDLLIDEKVLLDSLKAKIDTLGQGSITLIYPTDATDNALTGDSISISKTGGTQTHTLTANGVFDSYRWRVDGSAKGSGQTLALDAADYAPGIHQISLEVTLNGMVYSKSGSFTVTQ
jgi:hypothetical protein